MDGRDAPNWGVYGSASGEGEGRGEAQGGELGLGRPGTSFRFKKALGLELSYN